MPRDYDDTIDVSQYGVETIDWRQYAITRDLGEAEIDRCSVVQSLKNWNVEQRRLGGVNEVCEVCGEPLFYSPYHICHRCRIAALKFKDCLAEEDLGNG